MVDDIDNQVDGPGRKPAWVLAIQLLGAFRALVDEAHALLAADGFPDVRPVHGFALQAVGAGASASEVAARLGVTKQAVAKTLGMLEEQGYVARTDDPLDARRRLVVRTARGVALLEASERAFEAVVDRWRAVAGDDAVAALEGSLGRVLPGDGLGLDLGAWSS